MPEQEAVAGVDLLGRHRRRRGVVEHARYEFAPPVEYLEEQAPVPFGGVNGLHQAEVGGEAHLPRLVARRLVEIDNRCVRRMRGIDGEVHRPVDPLVRSRLPERLPLRIRPACSNLQLRHSHDRLL